MDKKTSVIIPVYNSEKWLKRCIDSVLNQTYKNFELILVDDGSTDTSDKICDEYAMIDDRVKVIHQKNAGASAARNTGIINSNGEYIMFVDSDDYITESMLEKLIFEMSNDIDLVVSSIKMVGNKSEKEFIMPNCVLSAEDYVSMYCERKFPRLCLEGPCCKIYKTRILKENNVSFIKTLTVGEDEHFNMQYISCCKKIRCCENIDYFYVRENEGSLSTTFPHNLYEQIDLLFRFDVEMLQKIGCQETDIDNLKKIYSYKMLTNVPKAVNTSFRDYKSFVKKISKNKIIKSHLNSIEDKRFFMIGKLIFLRAYLPLYIICRLMMKKNK